jgi:hypothetical protein
VTPRKKPLPPEKVAQLDAALQRTNGNVTQAAELLGMGVSSLYKFIDQTPDLSVKWGIRKGAVLPPGGAASIYRPPVHVPAGMNLEEVEAAHALALEDESVKAGLESIGVHGAARDMALALQKFTRQHFTKAIQILGGGITKQFLEVMAEVDSISKELRQPLLPEREQMLREDRCRLLDFMLRSYDRGDDAAMTQAKIAAMSSGTGKARKPRGYLSVGIQAQPGSTLNVNVPKEEGGDTKET